MSSRIKNHDANAALCQPAYVLKFALVHSVTILLLTTLLYAAGLFSSSQATRLPEDLTKSILQQFPGAHVRLDGSIETSDGDLFLPVVPINARASNRIEVVWPDSRQAQVVVLASGWCYLKVIRKGGLKSIALPTELPEKILHRLMAGRFPPDLVVPERFVLPLSLKSIAGDCAIELGDDAMVSQGDFRQPSEVTYSGPGSAPGAFFLTSLSTGRVTWLDDRTLAKIAEFPTEGTPCHLACLGGKLYVADQAKDRILVLDPGKGRFTAQIHMPRRSAPTGLAGAPGGRLLYAAESGAGRIAVIEAASGKTLLHTKVPPGPGAIKVTPNGHFLVVVSTTSGKVSILSTMNQRLLGSVAAGAHPTDVAITGDSKLAYVSNRRSNSVSIIHISRREQVATITTGNSPTGLALSRDDRVLYVANARDNTITVYNTDTREKTAQIDLPLDVDFPSAIFLCERDKKLLVSSEASGFLGLLNLGSLKFEEPVRIGHSSHDIIWAPFASPPAVKTN